MIVNQSQRTANHAPGWIAPASAGAGWRAARLGESLADLRLRHQRRLPHAFLDPNQQTLRGDLVVPPAPAECGFAKANVPKEHVVCPVAANRDGAQNGASLTHVNELSSERP